jgi:hypothetical protein
MAPMMPRERTNDLLIYFLLPFGSQMRWRG